MRYHKNNVTRVTHSFDVTSECMLKRTLIPLLVNTASEVRFITQAQRSLSSLSYCSFVSYKDSLVKHFVRQSRMDNQSWVLKIFWRAVFHPPV